MANSRPEEKLNHVSLDGNKSHRITKRTKEMNDTKSKKDMKKNMKERSVKKVNEKAHICRGRGLYETKLLVFRKSSVFEGKGSGSFFLD